MRHFTERPTMRRLRLVVLSLCLVILAGGSAFGWQAKTSRFTTHNGDGGLRPFTGSWLPQVNVVNPGRTSTWWDNDILGEPDPWDKMYDTDHSVPTGFWVSKYSDGYLPYSEDAINYEAYNLPDADTWPFYEDAYSRATLWVVADASATVSIWMNPMSYPVSLRTLGSTPSGAANSGYLRLTRIDCTEKIRQGYPGPVPVLYTNLRNDTERNKHIGLFFYMSFDWATCDDGMTPFSATHVYNFQVPGYNYISMPLYITSTPTYPNCTLTSIFTNLTPGINVWFYEPAYSSSWIAINPTLPLTTVEPTSGMTYADILRTYTFLVHVSVAQITVSGIPVLEQRYLDNAQQGWHYFGSIWGTSVPTTGLDALNAGTVGSVNYWNLATGAWSTATSIDAFKGYCALFSFSGQPRNHLDLQGNSLSGSGCSDTSRGLLASESPSGASYGLTDIANYFNSLGVVNSPAPTRIGTPVEDSYYFPTQPVLDPHIYIPPAMPGVPLPPPVETGYRRELAERAVAMPEFEILQNPNNQQITFRFESNREQELSISLAAVNGEKVADIYNGLISAGPFQSRWNHAGLHLSSGVYLVQVTVDGVAFSKKLLIVNH